MSIVLTKNHCCLFPLGSLEQWNPRITCYLRWTYTILVWEKYWSRICVCSLEIHFFHFSLWLFDSSSHDCLCPCHLDCLFTCHHHCLCPWHLDCLRTCHLDCLRTGVCLTVFVSHRLARFTRIIGLLECLVACRNIR